MASQMTVHDGVRSIAETQPHAFIVHLSLYHVVRKAVHQAKLPKELRVILLNAHTTKAELLASIDKGDVQHVRDVIAPGQVTLPLANAQVQLDDTVLLSLTSYVLHIHNH
ncbi:hypothetical protein AMAG_09959 [Allomyces macrogynus ATCC 38327]|uniref:Uncharacterized protein n=1 Tax=Allomyces macrogynus (strain ATCC 38327) TaxID=578462 RepID=A0A0L0SQ29_ALLM3|nr:hypothetical protein AMAG_09959 [Allomyces macrogynus ATCC 38327]|eukprot:KNE64602.1 hypothetical protein AMAG_09959 [Allomyces macrogynus ATCC 38327]